MATITIGSIIIDLKAGTAQFEKGIKAATKQLHNMGSSFKDAGRTLTAAVTLPLVAAAGAAVKFGISFESAFAGVRKTVNATEAEFAVLRQGFRDLAKEIPISANELARIGEAAGQLGIQTENILSFTKNMALLGVTTNMSSDEAATALARFANITRMSQNDFDRLGATIVELGNNFATTEREIVEFGMRIAAAGTQIGLSEAEIMGFATALSSVGLAAESGGTAISRVFLEIQKQVATGGKNLEVFASIAGKTVEEFKRHFREDAATAVIDFIEGLGRLDNASGETIIALEALGMSNIRIRDAMLRASGAGDLLRKAVEIGTEAWRSNTAMLKEAEQRFKTTESLLKLVANRLVDVGITIYDKLRPVIVGHLIPALDKLVKMLEVAVDWFTKLPPAVQTTALAFTALAGISGPVLYFIGGVMMGAKDLIRLFPYLRTSVVAVKEAFVALSLLTHVRSFSDLAAAISLATKESALLRAGLWALPIAYIADGLRQGVKATYELADGQKSLGQTIREQNQIWDTQKGIIRNLIDFIEKPLRGAILAIPVWLKAAAEGWEAFKEGGIAGLTGWAKRLGEEIQGVEDKTKSISEILPPAMAKTQASVAGLTPEMAKAGQAAGEAGKKAGEFAGELSKMAGQADAAVEAQKRLVESFQSALRPADDLAKTLDALKVAGMKQEDILRVYGDRILEASKAQRGFSQDIAGTTAEWEKMATAAKGIGHLVKDQSAKFKATKRAIEQYNAMGLKPVIKSTDLMTKGQRDLLENLEKMKKLPGEVAAKVAFLTSKQVDNAVITATMGSELKQAAEYAKLFGIELDPATRALVRQMEAAEENAKFAKQWQNAWSTAVGNVVSRFADGVADMLFEGKKFSLNLIDIFKELGKTLVKLVVMEIFESLLKAAAKFGKNFGEQILKWATGGGFDWKGLIPGLGTTAAKTAAPAAAPAAIPAVAPAAAPAAGGGGAAAGGALAAVAGMAGIIAAGILTERYLIPKDFADKIQKEFKRDFGVKLKEYDVRGFFSEVRASMQTDYPDWDWTEQALEKLRKDLSVSPLFLKMAFDVAQAQGKVEAFLTSLQAVETAWGTYDFRTPFEKGLTTGAWDDLNNAYKEAFGQTELFKEVIPDITKLFLENTEQVGALAAETSKAAESFSQLGEIAGGLPVDTFVDALNPKLVEQEELLRACNEELTKLYATLSQGLPAGFVDELARVREASLDSAMPSAALNPSSTSGTSYHEAPTYVNVDVDIHNPIGGAEQITRQVIMPQITRALQTGTGGHREDWTKIINNTQGGV